MDHTTPPESVSSLNVQFSDKHGLPHYSDLLALCLKLKFHESVYVLLSLLRHHMGNNTETWVSVARLRDLTGWSRAKVERCIHTAVEHRILIREKRQRAPKTAPTCHYRFDYQPGWVNVPGVEQRGKRDDAPPRGGTPNGNETKKRKAVDHSRQTPMSHSHENPSTECHTGELIRNTIRKKKEIKSSNSLPAVAGCSNPSSQRVESSGRKTSGLSVESHGLLSTEDERPSACELGAGTRAGSAHVCTQHDENLSFSPEKSKKKRSLLPVASELTLRRLYGGSAPKRRNLFSPWSDKVFLRQFWEPLDGLRIPEICKLVGSNPDRELSLEAEAEIDTAARRLLCIHWNPEADTPKAPALRQLKRVFRLGVFGHYGLGSVESRLSLEQHNPAVDSPEYGGAYVECRF